jgi:hypothetical protein
MESQEETRNEATGQADARTSNDKNTLAWLPTMRSSPGPMGEAVGDWILGRNKP